MTKKITCTLVSEENRTSFLPLKLPKHFIKFEMLVYTFMDRFCEEYTGGYWEFYDLSNNGFYIKLDSDNSFNVSNLDNYFREKMNTDATCVAINLFALNYLACTSRNEDIISLYYKLHKYALQHEDATQILRFID